MDNDVYLTMEDGSKVRQSDIGWMVINPETGRIVSWGPPMELQLDLSFLTGETTDDNGST